MKIEIETYELDDELVGMSAYVPMDTDLNERKAVEIALSKFFDYADEDTINGQYCAIWIAAVRKSDLA